MLPDDVGTGRIDLATGRAVAGCYQGILAKCFCFAIASLATELKIVIDSTKKWLCWPIVSDGFGYLPIDADCAQLLFHVNSDG